MQRARPDATLAHGNGARHFKTPSRREFEARRSEKRKANPLLVDRLSAWYAREDYLMVFDHLRQSPALAKLGGLVSNATGLRNSAGVRIWL